MKKLVSLVLAFMLVLSCAAFAEEVVEIPREETLYFCGQQWGAPNSWNPVGVNQNNAMACTQSTSGSRTLMFETLYMYNVLDGSLTPLLADGDYEVSEDQTTWTIKIKDAAKWSDGTAITAEDEVKTWETNLYIGNSVGIGYAEYIESIEAIDEKTIVIHAAVTEDGTVKNPLKIKDFLVGTYVCQKAWLETLYERNNGDATARARTRRWMWFGPAPTPV